MVSNTVGNGFKEEFESVGKSLSLTTKSKGAFDYIRGNLYTLYNEAKAYTPVFC